MATQLHQREDRLGVDGHVALGALEPVPGEHVVVVLDDAVVDSHHGRRAGSDGCSRDLRVTLRVVAHVDEGVLGGGRDLDLVEERAGTASQLRDAATAPSALSRRIADGVGAALRDPGEQRLRRERSLDGRLGVQAVARNAAHIRYSTASIGRRKA